VQVKIPVSVGELLDKISILRIKAERMSDASKCAHVRHELSLLEPIAERVGLSLKSWYAQLDTVNRTLWDVEDELRRCEAQADFGSRFIELARSVYRTNDRRAAIKREINAASGSEVIEEKSYESY
jgi:hypothetical protein